MVSPVCDPDIDRYPILERSRLDRDRLPVLPLLFCVGNFVFREIANAFWFGRIANANRDERLQRWQFFCWQIANAVIVGEGGRDYRALPFGGFWLAFGLNVGRITGYPGADCGPKFRSSSP